MEELTPIRQIKVNFGTPLILSCPSSDALGARLAKEVAEVEDNPFDAFMADSYVWESSITPEERKTFDELTARVDAAGKDFSPGKDDDNTPAAEAYYKAEDEREKFICSTGKHLCFRCSYYTTHQAKGGTWVAICERMNGICGVRPYGISCPHFTTEPTPQMLNAEKVQADACRRNPDFARFVRMKQREDIARRFANYIMTSPSTAFFIYKDAKAYYERLYNDFPLIMAEARYPSLPLFLEAYERWEKDVSIKKDRGVNGEEKVALSVSQKEFPPPGSPLPQTSAETSETKTSLPHTYPKRNL